MLESLFKWMCCTERDKDDAEKKYKSMQKTTVQHYVKHDDSFGTNESSSESSEPEAEDHKEPITIHSVVESSESPKSKLMKKMTFVKTRSVRSRKISQMSLLKDNYLPGYYSPKAGLSPSIRESVNPVTGFIGQQLALTVARQQS